MKTCFYNRPGGFTWMDMVDLSVEYGFDCLELFTSGEFAEPDLKYAEKFRKYADEKGVGICCFSSFVDLTGDDSARQVERMKSKSASERASAVSERPSIALAVPKRLNNCLPSTMFLS